jgi:hypothetical protein
MYKKVKIKFHFFVLFLKINFMKIIVLNDLPNFFNHVSFLLFKFDQISTRPIRVPEELSSVEIFWLSFMVPEI